MAEASLNSKLILVIIKHTLHVITSIYTTLHYLLHSRFYLITHLRVRGLNTM